MLSCSSPVALCPRVALCCPPASQVGIAIVNDFKSIEGDRALGLQVSGNARGTTEQKKADRWCKLRMTHHLISSGPKP